MAWLSSTTSSIFGGRGARPASTPRTIPWGRRAHPQGLGQRGDRDRRESGLWGGWANRPGKRTAHCAFLFDGFQLSLPCGADGEQHQARHDSGGTSVVFRDCKQRRTQNTADTTSGRSRSQQPCPVNRADGVSQVPLVGIRATAQDSCRCGQSRKLAREWAPGLQYGSMEGREGAGSAALQRGRSSGEREEWVGLISAAPGASCYVSSLEPDTPSSFALDG